jgi:peptidoglycan/LPS O-acetylase OafA/YrhL
VFGAFQADGVGTSLFALWLAGAAIYLTLRHIVPPLWVSTLVLACAAVAYWFMLTPGHEYDVTTYPALVLSVGSLIAVTQRTRLIVGARITKIIRLAADYSFTLYLIHHTIMVAVTTIYPAAAGYLWFWGAVLTSNVIAYLIARPFEMRHRQFADWLSRTSSLRIESADPAVALSKYDVH